MLLGQHGDGLGLMGKLPKSLLLCYFMNFRFEIPADDLGAMVVAGEVGGERRQKRVFTHDTAMMQPDGRGDPCQRTVSRPFQGRVARMRPHRPLADDPLIAVALAFHRRPIRFRGRSAEP